jgi:hypothetical protein
VAVQDVPALSTSDIKALESIRTHELFSVEKSAELYQGVMSLRPKG